MKRWAPLIVAAVALALLAIFTWGNAAAGARAWLFAFVLASMIPIGSLALLLVWGISGGRWGEDFAPVLVPAARAMPLLFLAFVPVMALRPLIYDWSGLHLPHNVLAWYLNPLFFDLRTLIAIALWSVLAWTSAWRNQLWAALGLTAHLIVMTFVPADWVLTLKPGSVSAGFGMGFGIEQMFAALGVVAVLAPQQAARANRDLAGIIVTCLLATVYFFYMAFLITWYGNIPAKVHWYAVRAGAGWETVGFLAFLIGAGLPFLAALSPYVRREPSALRYVGGAVLVGTALHVAWMTLPAFGGAAILPAIFALFLLAPLLFAAARYRPTRGAYGR